MEWWLNWHSWYSKKINFTNFLKCERKNSNFSKLSQKFIPVNKKMLLKIWVTQVLLLEQYREDWQLSWISKLCASKLRYFQIIRNKIEKLNGKIIFCIRQKSALFRENQRRNNYLQFWFLTKKISFSALFPFFRAESALFRDFQVSNIAESKVKHFWIRADQRWMSLRRHTVKHRFQLYSAKVF